MSNIRCKLQTFAIATAAASSLAAFVVAQPAMAFVLRGTLTNITFESLLDPMPTVTANGSFDYDTVADRYSNINIAISDGVTFSSADVFAGNSSFFLIQKSPRTTNLSLTFSTPLTSVTPPDFVGLHPGPNSEIGCLYGDGGASSASVDGHAAGGWVGGRFSTQEKAGFVKISRIDPSRNTLHAM
jgi:hypothetical protein